MVIELHSRAGERQDLGLGVRVSVASSLLQPPKRIASFPGELEHKPLDLLHNFGYRIHSSDSFV